MDKQKTVKEKFKMPANIPDLILEGHEDVADYALGWSTEAPILASGGKDKKILIWNIEKFLQYKLTNTQLDQKIKLNPLPKKHSSLKNDDQLAAAEKLSSDSF